MKIKRENKLFHIDLNPKQFSTLCYLVRTAVSIADNSQFEKEILAFEKSWVDAIVESIPEDLNK